MLRQFSIGSRVLAIIGVFSVSIAMLLMVIVVMGNMMKDKGVNEAFTIMMDDLVRESARQMTLIAKAVDGQSSSSMAVTELVNNVNSVVEQNGDLIAAADSRVQTLRHQAGELLALVAVLRK
jgi:methyl-accepting chemotaxis protein